MEPGRNGVPAYIRRVCGDVCGMSGTGHCGDAQHDSGLRQEDWVPAWAGDCDPGGGHRKAGWESVVFYTAGVFVRRLGYGKY